MVNDPCADARPTMPGLDSARIDLLKIHGRADLGVAQAALPTHWGPSVIERYAHDVSELFMASYRSTRPHQSHLTSCVGHAQREVVVSDTAPA